MRSNRTSSTGTGGPFFLQKNSQASVGGEKLYSQFWNALWLKGIATSSRCRSQVTAQGWLAPFYDCQEILLKVGWRSGRETEGKGGREEEGKAAE